MPLPDLSITKGLVSPVVNGFVAITGSGIFIVTSLWPVLVVAEPCFTEFIERSGVVAKCASWIAFYRIAGCYEVFSDDCFFDWLLPLSFFILTSFSDFFLIKDVLFPSVWKAVVDLPWDLLKACLTLRFVLWLEVLFLCEVPTLDDMSTSEFFDFDYGTIVIWVWVPTLEWVLLFLCVFSEVLFLFVPASPLGCLWDNRWWFSFSYWRSLCSPMILAVMLEMVCLFDIDLVYVGWRYPLDVPIEVLAPLAECLAVFLPCWVLFAFAWLFLFLWVWALLFSWWRTLWKFVANSPLLLTFELITRSLFWCLLAYLSMICDD